MLNKPQSKLTNRSAILVTSLLLAVAVVAMPGCQAFKSKFASLPKLPSPGDLAFWNKESDTAPPPPPSQHLNPSLTSGAKAMLSQNESGGSSDIDIDEYRRKINEMENSLASAQSKMDVGSGSKPNLGSGSKPNLGSGSKPIRKPYGDSASTFASTTNDFKSDLNSGFKSAGNSIDAGLKAAREKASTFGTNSLSDAQQKFNAIAEVKAPESSGDFRSPADILSSKPANDFKQALANTQSQLKSGIDSIKKNTGFDSTLGKVNKSLYDINGKLTTGALNTSNAVGNTAEAARQRFNSALGTISDGAIEAAKNSTEFGGSLKDKIVSAASELTPPIRGGDNSFKPAFKAAVDPVKTNAQNLFSQAKDRVGSLGSGFAKPQPPKFAPSVSADAPVSGGQNFNRTRVANVTPVATPPTQPTQTPTFSSRTGLDSSLTKAWNNGSQQSQLKPIGITAPSSMPGNGLRTASAEVSTLGSGNATASSIPAAFDQNRNAMTGHVSEIDIPAKILSGTGTYAPGSVNKVR